MKTNRSRILKAITQDVWAIVPEQLERICLMAQGLYESKDPVVELLRSKEGEPLNFTRAVSFRNGFGIIPITGPIFRRANLLTEMSGATSIEMLALDLQAALDDDKVEHILLEIDSPGGQVTGISELAEQIANSHKPVTAYVEGSGNSAAYWLASAADKIIVSPTAILGSIGAVAGVDVKGDDDSQIKFISSQSPRKQMDPRSDDGAAEMQALVDDLASVFISAVAKNRGVSEETVLTDFGQGGIMVGEHAVAAGLADAVGSFESVIVGRSGIHSSEVINMSDGDKKTVLVSAISVAMLQSDFPDIASELKALGLEEGKNSLLGEGKAAGAKAERERIESIFSLDVPGYESVLHQEMFNPEATRETTALKVLDAQKEKKVTTLKAVEADGKTIAAAAGSLEGNDLNTGKIPAAAADDIEAVCREAWDADADLRDEFAGDFEAYAAFAEAEANGQIKMKRDAK